jgi:hypothetical protein
MGLQHVGTKLGWANGSVAGLKSHAGGNLPVEISQADAITLLPAANCSAFSLSGETLMLSVNPAHSAI